MISIDDALNHVASLVRPLAAEQVPLANALGRVLAEYVASDVDSPPHDKSVVDGYAVRAADVGPGDTTLTIVEEITAGDVPRQAITPGAAARIMTGAPVPQGADAVVMVEQTQCIPSAGSSLGEVRLQVQPVAVGQNITRRAASMHRGEVVLNVGHELRPLEIGLLAEVGRSEIGVFRRPAVAVLPTGNELVSPGEVPAGGQIRNSNGAMLLAAVRRAGGEPVELDIGRDNRDSLKRLMSEGLRCDVLLVSGGVSAGVLDLAPAVLADLGVRQVFHKVNIKPGKPLWFGVLETGGSRKLVFGLPGNPVSSLVCFELFVLPALHALRGQPFTPRATAPARLAVDFEQRGDRVAYFPSKLYVKAGARRVEPLAWKGSGDLRTLSAANALICFPAGSRRYEAGETVEVMEL